MALMTVIWLLVRQVRQRRLGQEVRVRRRQQVRHRQRFRHQEGCQRRQRLQAEAVQEL